MEEEPEGSSDGRGTGAGPKKHALRGTSAVESRSPRRSSARACLVARVVVQCASFFELVAGAATPSATVKDLAPTAHVLNAGDAWRDSHQDLLDDQYLHHCAMLSLQTLWLQQAPPCRTFTRARRSDK